MSRTLAHEAAAAEMNEVTPDALDLHFTATCYDGDEAIWILEDATTGDGWFASVDEAMEVALEAAILHDDVVADPNAYHVDTLAHHGVAVPVDHPQRAEVVPSTCAAEFSPDCTGEGTAYAGRCLPCDLGLAAQEEMMAAQFAEDIHCSY